MNNVNIIGRLVNDVELTYFDTEKEKLATTRFTLANRRNEKETDFIDFKAIGKTAEILNQYTKKGGLIAIVGRIQKDIYEKNGEKKSSVYVFVNKLVLLDKKEKEETKPQLKPNEEEDAWGCAKDIDITTEELPFY